MVKVFKSVKCTLEDFEVYEGLIKDIGICPLPMVNFCKMSDIFGLQAYDGDTWLGKTLLLRSCRMYYDKWGFPVYHFCRYTEPTNQSAYIDFKTRHRASYLDFQ